MAVKKFGGLNQCVIAIEEMSELTKEICKFYRGGYNFDALAEEIADVTIMLEQLRIIFNINEEVCEQMDRKVIRLEERVNKNEKKRDS